MTGTMIRLGMRAVECKSWKWLPGMLYQYREESDEVTIPTKHYWCDPTRVRDHNPDTPACCGGLSIPDLQDPATLGCLLTLVREAWGQDDMGAFRCRERWCIEFTPQEGQHYAFYGCTEAKALVIALESAP